MANPFPVAAVVLPRESSASVLCRTSGSRCACSAMPPALSATGPYASVASVMPRVDSMADRGQRDAVCVRQRVREPHGDDYDDPRHHRAEHPEAQSSDDHRRWAGLGLLCEPSREPELIRCKVLGKRCRLSGPHQGLPGRPRTAQTPCPGRQWRSLCQPRTSAPAPNIPPRSAHSNRPMVASSLVRTRKVPRMDAKMPMVATSKGSMKRWASKHACRVSYT